jgi:hypothetical protein
MKWTFILLIGLAGCGGSGASSVDRQVTFDQMHQAVVSQQITPFSQVPDGGSYLYSGQMQLNLPIGASTRAPYFGSFDMSIAVSDTTAGMTGDVGGFTGADGDALGGTLVFSGGTLLPDADPDRYYLISADIDGQLTSGGVGYDLSGRVAADFYGPDADSIAGVVFGDITQGGNVDIFDGAFAGRAVP